MNAKHGYKFLVGTALAAVAAMMSFGGVAQAQVPPDIEAGLRKIGQIVDPACTAKLYRPLMPAKDFNTYWPVGAPAPVDKSEIYPGVTIMRDQSFGPNTKDVLDVFIGDKGPASRDVLIYVPGGGGNKIEQQDREANAFYDNIGRWATENGMIGVTVQRHPGTGNWDDGGRDVSHAVDWVQANIGKYHGNPKRMFIWAQSAGNGPTGVYLGHPERWDHGVAVIGAVFESGNPVPGVGGPAGGGGGGRGAGGGAAAGAGAPPAGGAGGGGGRAAAAPSTCGAGGANANDGMIAGPSGQAPAAARGAGGAAGGGAGRGAAAQLTDAERAERDNLPGFEKTKARILLARAELDPGVTDGKMAASDIALHDDLCKLDGPKAKDGKGHCPTMLFMKGESHMSAVFSIDTSDKTVSGPVLAFIKSTK